MYVLGLILSFHLYAISLICCSLTVLQAWKASCEVLKIPFYDLKKEFKKLDSSKTYLLYCDKGVLSQLHGQYLKDEGKYTNIKVFRP